ncbi:MAG: hypothetical protein ICV77_07815 [Cyanobacteria bacterium Co-bin8]|nr:hypothetical protein [Cyanobacteria bacterium Co-bin8]
MLVTVLISGCIPVQKLRQSSPFTKNFSRYKNERIAANYRGSLSRNGLELSMLRFSCLSTRSHAVNPDGTVNNLAAYPIIFGLEPKTICLVFFEVENNSSESCTFTISQGTVTFKEHAEVSIDLEKYRGHPPNIDFVSGSIPSSAKYITGILIPIPEIPWNRLGSVIYSIPSPICSGEENSNEEYEFVIDTTNWGYESIPTELSRSGASSW